MQLPVIIFCSKKTSFLETVFPLEAFRGIRLPDVFFPFLGVHLRCQLDDLTLTFLFGFFFFFKYKVDNIHRGLLLPCLAGLKSS